jgi:hypothetical protein
VELLAAVPLVIAAALVAWQLVAALAAGMRAEQRVRTAALVARGAPGVIVVSATAGVPSLLPGAGGMRVSARAGVRPP